MRHVLFLAALAGGLVAPAAPQAPPDAVLFVESSVAGTLSAQVLLIAVAPLEADAQLTLTLMAPGGHEQTASAPVPASAWSTDGLQLVALGPLTLDPGMAGELTVSGGLAGTRPQRLGTLVRGGDGRVQLRRAMPFAAEGPGRVFALASAERVGPGRFTVKVAYLNCGEQLDRDYDAFLHFEPEATGGNLAVTTEMGLYPSGKPTDSSAWREDDVTVVTFGPYDLPPDLAKPLYVRVGLYDREGDGARLPLAGGAEDDRVLVGGFATQDGRIVFERTPLGEAAP
jgi:hypothetical protein